MTASTIRALASGCAVGALVLSAAFSAHAAELLLAQPSPCAIGDELSFRAERALGQSLSTAADLRCTIRIERTAEAFAARLELAGPSGEGEPRQRSFQASSCEQLTDALALAVVLAVGAAGADARPATGSVGPPAPSPVAATPGASNDGGRDATAEGASTPDAAARGGLPASRWGLRAALVGDAGALPGAGLGALLGGSVRWQTFELQALGTYLPSRQASLEGSGGQAIGAELGLLAGSLLACAPALVRRARLELGACAGAELGVLSGEGNGLSAPRSDSAPWWAVRGDLLARWGLGDGGLALEVLAGAVVPLSRDDFAVADAGRVRVVHRPAAVTVRASIGLGIELD